ncbi:hypothetical protein PCE1_005018 [Barthelona sp. PCE]
MGNSVLSRVTVENRTNETAQIPTEREDILHLVQSVANHTQPKKIVYFDGSDAIIADIKALLVEQGLLRPLKRPNCYLARTDVRDVARVESATQICTETREEAGKLNNWMETDIALSILKKRFDGVMHGQTMYVVPIAMGRVGRAHTMYSIMITDSPFVVLNLSIMSIAGDSVLTFLNNNPDMDFTPLIHSVEYPIIGGSHQPRVLPVGNPSKKLVCHFPRETGSAVVSISASNGGDAILPKKTLALRIASYMGRKQGWMAEHMFIIKVTNPAGREFVVLGCYPSACGKTTTAMCPAPEGWKIETIGDDIAWLWIDSKGKLRCINPEAGFFGVSCGTAEDSVAGKMLQEDAFFTNVALTDDNDVYWEGMNGETPEHLIDWVGNDWTPAVGKYRPAAHPNARYTVSKHKCPILTSDYPDDDEAGILVDAIILGSRRANLIPLVRQANSWEEGVFMGSTMSSEVTAASQDQTVGAVRFDLFANRPFIGYDATEYLQHWLDLGKTLGSNAPKIFYSNWFLKNDEGKFMWPGFAENARIIQWVCNRCEGSIGATSTPVGLVPSPGDIPLDNLTNAKGEIFTQEDFDQLIAFDKEGWRKYFIQINQWYRSLESETSKIPTALRAQLYALRNRLA